ncbi:MAG: hypothetical protein KDA25_02750 [Phycisphaerales bacterium]|nr:hypothetical protein [Phycisphaerales bacterium]
MDARMNVAERSHRRTWPMFLMVVMFGLVALESLIVAAVMKGPWLVLLAPAAVCAIKGAHLWRDLARAR